MSTALQFQIMIYTFVFSFCAFHSLMTFCFLCFVSAQSGRALCRLRIWKCALPIKEQECLVDKWKDCGKTTAFTLALLQTGRAGVWATRSTKRDACPAASSSGAPQSGNQRGVRGQTCENSSERGTKGCCKGSRVKGKVGQRHSEQVLPS